LTALAADYAAKSERDQEALERMVFYAQTGFCRWRVLLESFDEPLPFVEHCGRCDNCLRRLAQPVEALFEPAPEARGSPQPAFNVGDAVGVPRYGDGRVTQVADDAVTVQFPDASTRSFVASFLRPAESGPGVAAA